MSFIIELILQVIFRKIIYGTLTIIGASVRFIFLFDKCSFSEVLKQEYNGRIGFIVFAILFMVFIYFRFRIH